MIRLSSTQYSRHHEYKTKILLKSFWNFSGIAWTHVTEFTLTVLAWKSRLLWKLVLVATSSPGPSPPRFSKWRVTSPENGDVTLRMYQMFSSIVSRRNQLRVILDMCVEENLPGKSHDINDRDAIALKRFPFQSVFHPHDNKTPEFSNSSGLKSVFQKRHFLDGLMWTVGLRVELKLRFQICLLLCVEQTVDQTN